MTVLVDSWSWIEYFRGSDGGKKAMEFLEGSEEVVIVSAINLAEVYCWILRFYSERVAEEKKKVMKQRSFVCDVDEGVAINAAKIKREKKWGLADAIVYATAKRENAKILTGDADFKGMDGVIFIG